MTKIRNAEPRLRFCGLAAPEASASGFGFRISRMRLACVLLFLACLPLAQAQLGAVKVAKIEIKHVGPSAVSDELIRSNIRLKPGDPYLRATVDDDVRNLYSTGFFYNIRVAEDNTPDGVVVTYIVQGKPRLTEIKFQGNTKFSDAKLRKKLSSKVGEPLDERKLFTDSQEIQKMYQKSGYPRTQVKYVLNIDENSGRGTATFEITESPKVKIIEVDFIGAKAYPQKKLRKVIKTRKHWMFSWITSSGVLKDDQFEEDQEKLKDYYRDHGYIDVSTSSRNLNVLRIPNTETGTMDLEFKLDEGQKSYIEKIEIRGNTKTKDRVIRRELAVSPGEVFDMVRVKVSKQRLEGLQYFEKVDARPEPTEPPIAGHKNLVVGVDEKSTGNLTMGAGFSSVDSIVGFVEVSQGNFDLFHPPTFTGGGQKFRLRVQIGTQRQDYIISFIEPWFLGRKLSLGIEAYHRELNFQSVDNIYDETRTGARFSLTRALWRDSIIGSVSYTLEDVGIHLNSGFHGPLFFSPTPPGPFGGPGGLPPPPPSTPPQSVPANVPNAILEEPGNHLLSRIGGSLAYDTRGGGLLPNRGQRTELFAQFVGGPLGGSKEIKTPKLKTAWYFRGFMPGHILEVVGRTGVAESLESGDVPFYERFYLGGLYSMRGFKYRSISPREDDLKEPIGGDTYWFGSAEYSVPIIDRLRFALFYDIGNVAARPYDYNLDNLNDNFGFGIRLNLPIGPLRLDYGIPIRHDQFNSGSGRFQFGVGYTREF